MPHFVAGVRHVHSVPMSRRSVVHRGAIGAFVAAAVMTASVTAHDIGVFPSLADGRMRLTVTYGHPGGYSDTAVPFPSTRR